MDKDKIVVNKNTQRLETDVNKPDAHMIGADGNIFAQLGIANRALRESGQGDKISEMNARVMNSDSYAKALSIICEYVNPVERSSRSRGYER